MIFIDIQIKKHNKIKEFFHSLSSKAEDLLFSIIQHIPEKLIPSFIMNWLERYTDKRLAELQQDIIKQQWTQIELEEAISEIRQMQQDKNKAPTDD